MPKNVITVTFLAVAIALISLSGNLEILAFTPLFIIMCAAIVIDTTELIKAIKGHRYTTATLLMLCMLLAIGSLLSQFWGIHGLDIGG